MSFCYLIKPLFSKAVHYCVNVKLYHYCLYDETLEVCNEMNSANGTRFVKGADFATLCIAIT